MITKHREPGTRTEQRILPGGFCDSRNFAVKSHFAELDTANAKLSHIAFGPAGKQAAIVQAYRIGITREFVERIVVACFFELFAQLGVFSDHAFALILACDD